MVKVIGTSCEIVAMDVQAIVAIDVQATLAIDVQARSRHAGRRNAVPVVGT
jgi:hypothetical protein